MSDIGIGKIIDGEAHRDAVHFAIAPVVAKEKMYAGQRIGLASDGRASLYAETELGIVDPFLSCECVFAGQKFYMFLFPNSVTGMRHEWQHPAFDAPTPSAPAPVAVDPKEAAIARLKEIAAAIDCGYRQLMSAADTWLDSEEYTIQEGRETWRNEFPEYAEEFWKLYAVVEGKDTAGKSDSFFSCSC